MINVFLRKYVFILHLYYFIICHDYMNTSQEPVLDQTELLELGQSSCQHQGGPTKRSCPQDQTSPTIGNTA